MKPWFLIDVDGEPFVIQAWSADNAVFAALRRLHERQRLTHQQGMVAWEKITDPELVRDTGPCVEARVKLRRLERFAPPYAVEFGGAPWPERDVLVTKIEKCDRARARRVRRRLHG